MMLLIGYLPFTCFMITASFSQSEFIGKIPSKLHNEACFFFNDIEEELCTVSDLVYFLADSWCFPIHAPFHLHNLRIEVCALLHLSGHNIHAAYWFEKLFCSYLSNFLWISESSTKSLLWRHLKISAEKPLNPLKHKSLKEMNFTHRSSPGMMGRFNLHPGWRMCMHDGCCKPVIDNWFNMIWWELPEGKKNTCNFKTLRLQFWAIMLS